MSITRRHLYEAGEPFGDSATQKKLGGGYVCGGGGSSSSSASTTNNQDNRVAVQDGIGLSASNNNTIQIMDGGIVRDALDFSTNTVNQAFEFGGTGFERLINAAEKLFVEGQGLIGQTQKAVADAYSQAQTDAKSTIDNRTIIVLAVAGAATAFALSRRGK